MLSLILVFSLHFFVRYIFLYVLPLTFINFKIPFVIHGLVLSLGRDLETFFDGIKFTNNK